jgi:hypothetical protein
MLQMIFPINEIFYGTLVLTLFLWVLRIVKSKINHKSFGIGYEISLIILTILSIFIIILFAASELAFSNWHT